MPVLESEPPPADRGTGSPPRYLDLFAGLHLLLLGDGVGDHHRLEGGVVDARDGRPREDAVRQDGVHFDGAGVDQPGVYKDKVFLPLIFLTLG